MEEFDSSGEYPVKLHCYDHVFGDEATNQVIFDTVGCKLSDAALDGYNTVLFMYGQTSSGTRHRMYILIDSIYIYVHMYLSSSCR